MVADFCGLTAVVREPLQVGDQDKLLVVMLQRDALAQRADVVAKMNWPVGRSPVRMVCGWFIRDSLSDCSAERRPEKAAFRRL
jgi:hypothetical protein